jgi:archaellum component FlaC
MQKEELHGLGNQVDGLEDELEAMHNKQDDLTDDIIALQNHTVSSGKINAEKVANLKVLHAKAGKAVNVITDQILEENKTRFL